jgi:hypothetical protein
MPEQHTILGGRVYVYKRPNSSFSGNPQAISRARIVAPAQRTRASPKPRRSPRTGIGSFAGNSAPGRSRTKRRLAKCLNTTSANTTSSRRDNATHDTWTASTGNVADAWYVFSATSAFQRLQRATSRTTGVQPTAHVYQPAVDAFRRRLLSSILQYADKLGRVAATQPVFFRARSIPSANGGLW